MTPGKSALCLCLLLGAAPFAQTALTSPTPQRAQSLQAEIDLYKRLLDEYHQGKRDDRDGHAILFTLLSDSGFLGRRTAPEVQAWKAEYGALRQKHPEYRGKPPVMLHEQLEVQERQHKHAAEIAEKAKADFVPKDTSPSGVYGYDHRAVVKYQHHLDFHQLQPPITLKLEPLNSYMGPQLYNEKTGAYLHDDKITELGLKPFLVLTFRHRIQTSIEGPTEWHFVWVCDDLVSPDGPSDNEEGEIIRRKYLHGGPYWLNESAQYREFCGAIGLDGKVIYQLPLKQHAPDTVFDVGDTTPDGTSVVISVGESVDLMDNGIIAHDARKFRQALIWTYPDKLVTFDAKDAAKVNAALAAHGFHGRPWPWK